MTSTQTVTQQGVIYPDGSEDWDVTRTFGFIDTATNQEQFRKNYINRLAALGIAADGSALRFVERTAKTTYSEPKDIVPEPYTPSEGTPAS